MIMFQEISSLLIPLAVVSILTWSFFQDVKVFEVFVEGAGEGIKTVIGILPYLISMMIAIKMFQASGLLELVTGLGKFFSLIPGIEVPAQVLPLLFLRPLTGSGSLAYTSMIFKRYGPDSMGGLMASTIQGSTETTLYVASVYYGSCGIKDPGYSIKVGLISDLAGFVASILICNLFFS